MAVRLASGLICGNRHTIGNIFKDEASIPSSTVLRRNAADVRHKELTPKCLNTGGDQNKAPSWCVSDLSLVRGGGYPTVSARQSSL